ncbi:MAG: hypothetical protein MJ252_12225 [archaeon]|nr:hypothetical protein [archaeon]
MKFLALLSLAAILSQTFCITGTGDVTWYTGALGSCGRALTGNYIAMNGSQYQAGK